MWCRRRSRTTIEDFCKSYLPYRNISLEVRAQDAFKYHRFMQSMPISASDSTATVLVLSTHR